MWICIQGERSLDSLAVCALRYKLRFLKVCIQGLRSLIYLRFRVPKFVSEVSIQFLSLKYLGFHIQDVFCLNSLRSVFQCLSLRYVGGQFQGVRSLRFYYKTFVPVLA